MKIRKFQETDWSDVWPIIEKVVRAGETCAFSPDITENEAHKVWIEILADTYVAVDEKGRILGTYYIKAPRQDNLWVDFVALNGVIHKSTAACSVIQANKARGPCG